MRFLTQIAIALLIPSLVACGTSPQAEELYRAGWRRAQVLDVVDTARETETVGKDCRKDPAARAFTHFALTTEDTGNALKMRGKRIVPVTDPLQVRTGNLVFVHLTDCGQPLKRVWGMS